MGAAFSVDGYAAADVAATCVAAGAADPSMA
jgi:hypothetical protein